MEVGRNCAFESCQKLDFLPFACDRCQKVYCEDHFKYLNHGCGTKKEDKQVPVCPICNCPVPVPEGKDVNLVMSRHIDGGCKRAKGTGKGTVSSNQCGVCGKSELTPIICKDCNDTFCLKHRYADQHGCSDRRRAKSTARYAPSVPKGASAGMKAVRRRFLFSASKGYNNKKADAEGDSKVPPEERIVLAIQFPRSSKQPGIFMYFHRRWKVGKVIDLVAKRGKVPNRNNSVPDSQKLNIYTNDGVQLLPSFEISTAGVKPGDVIILERADVMTEMSQAMEGEENSGGRGKQECVIA